MQTDRPTTLLLLTRDLAIVQVASLIVPDEQTEWRQSFSSALAAITPDIGTLVVDGDLGAMAHLLAALFLDQKAGRSAVVIQPSGGPMRTNADARVQIVERPLTPWALQEALAEADTFALACQEIETLARDASMVPVGMLQTSIA